MKKSIKFLPLLSMGLVVVGCQDYDAGFTESDIKAKQYANDFQKTFGNVDPNQDWSMATTVTAHFVGVPDGRIEIFSKDPMGSDAVLLAMGNVVNGEATVEFDAVKSAKSVFVRINKAHGFYPINGTYAIKDGEVFVGSGVTRAAGDPMTGASRMTLGDPFSYDSDMLDWSKSADFTWNAAGGGTGYEHWIDGLYVSTNPTYRSGQPVQTDAYFYASQTMTNFYQLNNVIAEGDYRPEWYVKDIAHFFYEVDGEAPVFKEKEDHIAYMKPNSDPQFEKNVLYTTASEGPVYFDYFHKGTEFENLFGYFYFTGDVPTHEEFMTMNKYVLVDNMTTKASPVTISVDGEGNKTQKAWNLLMQNVYSGWDNYSYDGIYNPNNNLMNGTKLRGTRLQLTYFDDPAGPTYDFPEGVKIAFFIIGVGQSRDKVLTSIASLNADLYNDCPRAATFKYKGQTVFAMEDQKDGGDGDVNDIMFIAYGDFEEDEDIPDLGPEPEVQSWTVVCEDLGGTFDYDFNDLVFALRKTQLASDVTKCKLELIPLAAGGTLKAEVYYNDALKGEIHDMVKSGSATSSPINVTAGTKPKAGSAIVLADEIAWNTSINTIKANITVKVTKDDATTESDIFISGYTYDGNEAAQMILLPGGFDWTSEGTPLATVYEGFADWIADAEATEWCDDKAEGAIKYVTNPLAKTTSPVDPVTPTPEDPVTPPTTDPITPEPQEPATAPGTLVTLDSNGFISLSALQAVATEGSISIIVEGKGTQWQTGGVTLYWNEPRPDWGEGQTQETAIPGASATSAQYSKVDEPTTLTATLTAEQYATLQTYVGGLKVEVYNITDYSVYVKVNE